MLIPSGIHPLENCRNFIDVSTNSESAWCENLHIRNSIRISKKCREFGWSKNTSTFPTSDQPKNNKTEYRIPGMSAYVRYLPLRCWVAFLEHISGYNRNGIHILIGLHLRRREIQNRNFISLENRNLEYENISETRDARNNMTMINFSWTLPGVSSELWGSNPTRHFLTSPRKKRWKPKGQGNKENRLKQNRNMGNNW